MREIDKLADSAYEARKPGTFELPLDYPSGFRDGFESAKRLILFKFEQKKRNGIARLDKDLFDWVKELGHREVKP